MRAKALILLLALTGMAFAQGFADMAADVSGFATPDPTATLTFPADHAAHPDFRIEWWYLTATLKGEDGADYGVQWTLFRTAIAPGEGDGWQSPQLWMGHAAATTGTAHHVAERLARGGTGQAGVTLGPPFRAWIDDWQMLSQAAPGADPLSHLRLLARDTDFAYDLDLAAQGPLILHGAQGYSVKSAAGQASHYYSQPFYTVSGQLDLPEGPVQVTGQAWLDREWSSQPLAADQTGWDWFSLAFDSGERLMGFRLRDGGGGFVSGTWIAADGTATPLPPGALAVEPLQTHSVAGREVPVGWRLTLPDRALDVTISALNPDAWMATSIPYWEGPITIKGSHTGRGYLEMTGY
ncbi:MAG: iron ABC transporter permease [Rhodobacterales bacterium 32-66-7]|nr:MAG: iron ABC transporter permease [Rhodobacterales bacterium 12-65-15]OYX25195.1 MAG: iron ABC transporter permease [Rhodobacterales bacterium 32-66-7]